MRDNLPDQALHHRFVRFPTKRSLIILITFQSDWTGQRQVQCPVTQIVSTQLTVTPLCRTKATPHKCHTTIPHNCHTKLATQHNTATQQCHTTTQQKPHHTNTTQHCHTHWSHNCRLPHTRKALLLLRV